MTMLLHSVFLFNVFILPHIKGLSINSSSNISSTLVPQWHRKLNLTYSKLAAFTGASFKSHNRTRRSDKLKHTGVCPELDETEEHPFAVVITTRNYGRLLCMGSILDEYHVLTAKACFEKADAATITVIAGYLSPYWGRNSQVKYADRLFKHNKDIAIIFLKRPFTFTETVKPLKIIGPEKMNVDVSTAYPSPCAIVGFEFPQNIEQADFIPRESAYRMVYERFGANTTCDECHTVFTPSDISLFCTDGTSEFTWGAMGSPTVITVEKEFVQIGVLISGVCSARPPSDTKKDPNLHARIDRHYSWIRANSYIGR